MPLKSATTIPAPCPQPASRSCGTGTRPLQPPRTTPRRLSVRPIPYPANGLPAASVPLRNTTRSGRRSWETSATSTATSPKDVKE
ncbi:hypothetical protein ACFQY7_04975 [Actinomadura luteofluorescens]|uniref:hypothetical protein n=1 Tax=Actinomadura luteofluorescens TaxID=46163 RepID=UPI00362E3148